MIVLGDQLRLHLEHERLWGATEIPVATVVREAAPDRHLLVLGEAADLAEGPVRDLLAKMLTAIGHPLDTCRLRELPEEADQLAELVSPSTVGILAFGPRAAALLDSVENDSQSRLPDNLPRTHTYGPAHLLCRAADKAEAWSRLQFLQQAIN